jgi:hypothetical protein
MTSRKLARLSRHRIGSAAWLDVLNVDPIIEGSLPANSATPKLLHHASHILPDGALWIGRLPQRKQDEILAQDAEPRQVKR